MHHFAAKGRQTRGMGVTSTIGIAPTNNRAGTLQGSKGRTSGDDSGHVLNVRMRLCRNTPADDPAAPGVHRKVFFHGREGSRRGGDVGDVHGQLLGISIARMVVNNIVSVVQRTKCHHPAHACQTSIGTFVGDDFGDRTGTVGSGVGINTLRSHASPPVRQGTVCLHNHIIRATRHDAGTVCGFQYHPCSGLSYNRSSLARVGGA
mmetsp:Transcript_20833/g.34909  ORF Transcript_20833/g.34909 Transcript_20833/m.34909 type:complete len:205 (-) Transcript_20833:1258-1872(-)